MPRRSVKHILEANKEEIIRKYQDGMTQKQIGDEYGLNHGSVSALLASNGITTRHNPVGKIHRDEILSLDREGLSAYAIAKRLNIGRGVVERALHAEGIDISHRKWLPDEGIRADFQAIRERYLAGEGGDIIGKDYGVAGITIMKLLRKNGVETRKLRDYSYPVKEDYFDRIDTPNKAYILGFMMADGCNTQSKGVVRLSITDLDILEAIAAEMGWEGPIERIVRQEPWKDIYAFAIGCRQLSNGLGRAGCVQWKTYLATFPNDEQVSPHLHNHLIRGWLDGDGTITSRERKDQPNRRSWHSRIVGTQAACLGISNCISRHLGFPASVCPVHVGEKHITYGFTVGGNYQLKAYLDWVYKDAELFLARKQAVYEEFLAYFSAMKSE